MQPLIVQRTAFFVNKNLYENLISRRRNENKIEIIKSYRLFEKCRIL